MHPDHTHFPVIYFDFSKYFFPLDAICENINQCGLSRKWRGFKKKKLEIKTELLQDTIISLWVFIKPGWSQDVEETSTPPCLLQGFHNCVELEAA